MSPAFSNRVAGLKRTLIREIFESAPPEALNLGLGQPDLDPPPPFRAELSRAAAEGPAGYGPTAGDRPLREAVAAQYAGFAGGPDDVLITVGCQEATFVALGCLVDPGDEVLTPDPDSPAPLGPPRPGAPRRGPTGCTRATASTSTRTRSWR